MRFQAAKGAPVPTSARFAIEMVATVDRAQKKAQVVRERIEAYKKGPTPKIIDALNASLSEFEQASDAVDEHAASSDAGE